MNKAILSFLASRLVEILTTTNVKVSITVSCNFLKTMFWNISRSSIKTKSETRRGATSEISQIAEYIIKGQNQRQFSSTLWFRDTITQKIRPCFTHRYIRAKTIHNIQTSMSSLCRALRRSRSLWMRYTSRLTRHCWKGRIQLLELSVQINGFWTQIQSIWRFQAQNLAMGPLSTFKLEDQRCWLLLNSNSSSKSKLISATTRTSIQINLCPQLASSSMKTSPWTSSSSARAEQSTATAWYASSRRNQKRQKTTATLS